MSVRLVLVDFDDTLVETAPRFDRARDRLFTALERAGFPRELAERVHHDEVDREMIDRHGIGPARLAPSFRETYRRLCARAGRRPDPALLEACAAFARPVIGTPPPIDGALDALRRLARVHRTVLYTQAADRDYQLGCVREAGVLDVLDAEAVHIAEQKTPAAFRATLDALGVSDPDGAWMVGNSVRSDVNPALTAGARAIHIRHESAWRLDRAEPVSDDFERVDSFVEAVERLVRVPAADAQRTPRSVRAGQVATHPQPG